MKRQILLSPLGLFVLTLLMVTSTVGQIKKIAPLANQPKKTTPVRIAAKPDLVIEEVWLAKPGASAVSRPDVRWTGKAPLGGDIRLACGVKNAGADLKTPFAVTYLVDEAVVGVAEINGLAAGQTTFSSVVYKAQAAGTHKLRCEVDRENQVIETTRNNNTMEITFAVAEASVAQGLKKVMAPPKGIAKPTGGINGAGGTNSGNPSGSTTSGLGHTQIKDDRTPGARGREGGGPAFTPTGTPSPPTGTPYPPNETPLASAFVGSLPPLPQPEVTTALCNELVVVPGNDLVVIPADSSLVLLRTADLSRVTTVGVDGEIKDRSTTVSLDDGSAATFVSTTGGSLWRFDTKTLHVSWQRSLSRVGITSDQLAARPLVHLRRNASANYKTAHPIDMVYVSTDYSSDTHLNRVYALDAASGIPAWIFNDDQIRVGPVGPMVSSGSLDVDNDILFIGTQRPLMLGQPQSTVWAIDVLAGARVWSADCGTIENSPVPIDDRVLVASREGLVSAIDRNTGGLIWKLQMGQPAFIAKMTAAKFPNIGRAACIVMADGVIRMVRDNGNSGEVLWGISLPGGKKAKSRVIYEPDSNMLYVGADDSQVYQIDAASGTVTANRFVEMSGMGIIGDPFIWKARGVTKLIAGSSKGTIAEFLLPWPTEAFAP